MAPLGIQIAITAGSSSVARGGSIIPNLLGSSEDFTVGGTEKESNWDTTIQNTTTATSAETPPSIPNPRGGERATDLNFVSGYKASGIVNNFRGNGIYYNLSGTEYTFSIWAIQNSAKTSTSFRLRARRLDGSEEELEGVQTITSGWTRHSITFTIGEGGDFTSGTDFVFDVISENSQGATPGVTIFGAMLNEGNAPAPYQYKEVNLPPSPEGPGSNNPYLPNLIGETPDLSTGDVIILSESEENIYLITES